MFCSRCGTQVETSVRFCPNCGEDLSKLTGAGQGKTAQMAAPQEDETALIRDGLKEEYDLEKELGRGGMAVVYKARDKQLEREVAIKVLPFSLSFDAEFVERFQREARTAGKLEHPNIIPIYRVGRAGRVIYFVMKFIRGKSLSQAIEARGAMPVPEIKRMLKEATGALGYAHKHGIVHRDIKPDNIMFDELGQAIVTDFGIAKAQSGARLTGTGMSIGTPHYMSPEQARAQNLDGRSDIYSLGVVAYQCLTGHVPFDGEDSFSIGYKHIMEELPVPALDTAEQRDLFAVVQKMMAKKPEDRFQNADELVLALEGSGAASQADLSTMRTLAIEPAKLGMKPPPPAAPPPKPTGKPAAPPIASQATTPLPRASASFGKPKETEAEAAAPPPLPAAPPPPPPRPAVKRPMGGERKSGSKLPLALAAGLGIVALGLGGYYFAVMKPKQAEAAAQRARQDSISRVTLAGADSVRRDSLARVAAADSQRRADSIAAARRTELARRDPPPPRRDTARTRTTRTAADTGTLSIAWRGTTPANPRITVDGQPLPRRVSKLPVGTHQLRIEAEGFRPYTSTVTIQAGRTNSHPVRMEAAAGTRTDTARTGNTAGANCASPSVSLPNPRNACWDTRPRPRLTPQISAPSSCTGQVRPALILVNVGATGEVQGDPTVNRASNCEAFTALARAFALDMTFLPAQKGGQPVAAWVIVSISASRN